MAKRYSHSRCYAGHRGDCSTKLSAEHFLSRALLESIEISSGGVYVRGSPWQKSEVVQHGRALRRHRRPWSVERTFARIGNFHRLAGR
jgi:hypothetical protein